MWRVVSYTMKYSAALRRLSDGETTMNDFDNEILPTDPDEGEEITERVAGRETYEWVRSLVGAVLVITLLFTFVVRLMGVDGHSTSATSLTIRAAATRCVRAFLLPSLKFLYPSKSGEISRTSSVWFSILSFSSASS